MSRLDAVVREHLHGLPGQLQLAAALLLAGAVLAVAMLCCRPLFERHVREVWRPLPVELAATATAMADGTYVGTDPGPERVALLYEHWLARPVAPDAAVYARGLFAIGAETCLHRARLTLLCGDAAQRLQAVRFLACLDDARARALIGQACTAATRRREHDLAAAMRALLPAEWRIERAGS